MVAMGGFDKGTQEVEKPTKVLDGSYRTIAMLNGIGAGFCLILVVITIYLFQQGTIDSPLPAFFQAAGLLLFGTGATTRLVKAMHQRIPEVLTADTPPQFFGNQELSQAFKEGRLPIYRRAQERLRNLKRWLGGRLGFGTRPAQDTATRIQSRRAGFVFLAVLALIAGGLSLVTGNVLFSIVGILVGLGAAGMVTLHQYADFKVIDKLFPRQGPSIDSDERLGTVQGAGDPFVLRSEIEQRMLAQRARGLPNYVMGDGWRVPTMTLNETGLVEGKLSVETRPVYITERERLPWKDFANRSKGLAMVAAFLPVLLLPMFPGSVLLAVALTTLIAYAASSASLGDAETLIQKFRWKSVVIYAELEGSVGKTEIRAGRGMSDSFESSNTVIRSDCQVRVYAATIISENKEIGDPRDIIALHRTSASDQALQTVMGAIKDFEAAGVRIRGIDLNTEAISSTARANIMVEGHKASARGGEPPQSLDAPASAPNPQLEEGDDDADFDEIHDTQARDTSWGQPEAPAKPSMDHIARATRKMRMRCPKCSYINHFDKGNHIRCRNCGFAKNR